MWKKQIRAERAAEAASQMVAKAEALQKAAMGRPGSSGNEGDPSEDVSENEADIHSNTTHSVDGNPALSKSVSLDGQTENGLQDGPSDVFKAVDDNQDLSKSVSLDDTIENAQQDGQSDPAKVDGKPVNHF